MKIMRLRRKNPKRPAKTKDLSLSGPQFAQAQNGKPPTPSSLLEEIDDQDSEDGLKRVAKARPRDDEVIDGRKQNDSPGEQARGREFSSQCEKKPKYAGD
jgi:hypothetical protein